MSTRNLPGGKGLPARETDNLTALSRLSRKYGSLDVSQPYGPSWPVTAIFYLYLVEINQENMMGVLILESLVLPKTALLILHCEFSRLHERGTSFLFTETEVLLGKFSEPIETILPHNIPYSPSDLVEQIICK
jgi:hypothetical protein